MSYLARYKQEEILSCKKFKVYMYRQDWWIGQTVGIFVDSGKRGFALQILTSDINRIMTLGVEAYFGRTMINAYSRKFERVPKYFIETISEILPKIKGLTYNQCLNRFQDPSISPNSI